MLQLLGLLRRGDRIGPARVLLGWDQDVHVACAVDVLVLGREVLLLLVRGFSDEATTDKTKLPKNARKKCLSYILGDKKQRINTFTLRLLF